MIQAITFDFWDTLFVDDSDEPERAARGLAPKPVARRAAFVQAVLAAYPAVGEAAAGAAMDHADAWFRRCWKIEHHTPSVTRRLEVALDRLGVAPPQGWAALVASLEEMEARIPPRPVPGAAEALAALAARWPLGVVSDAIFTPGRCLRRVLEANGLLRYFTPSAVVFSDEAGAAKPAPAVFERAAAGFRAAGVDCYVGGLVHVGDREANDVDGPLAAGARGVLFTGAVDRRGGAPTRAAAVCDDLRALPAILAGLEA